MVMEKLRSEISSIARRISTKFHIKQYTQISEVLLTNEAATGDAEKRGLFLSDDKLIINKGFLRNPFFREYLISEVSKTFFPKVLLKIDRTIDFGYYIAYQLSKNRQKWLKNWEGESKPLYLKELSYQPSYDLRELDKVTDGKALKIIFNFFENVQKYKDHLNLEDYLFFYNSLQKDIAAKLSEREYFTLTEICRYNYPELTLISKNTGLSLKEFKRIYYKLKKHVWLNFLAFPNWPKIGLEYIIILVDPVNKYIEHVKDKMIKPYVRIIHRLGGGQASKFLIICTLPFGTTYVVEKYLRELEYADMIKNYSIMRPVSHTRSMNIKYYNIKKSKWELDEDSILYYAKLNENSSLPETCKLTFDYRLKNVRYDKTDVMLLLEIDKSPGLEISISSLSKKLKIPRKTIKERLRELREKDFYISYPTVYPPLIRLPETIFTILKGSEIEEIRKIKSLFLNLPDNYLFDLENGLISINHIPGGINDISIFIARQAMMIPGISEINLFFEHVHYGNEIMLEELYKRGGWVHPSKLWR